MTQKIVSLAEQQKAYEQQKAIAQKALADLQAMKAKINAESCAFTVTIREQVLNVFEKEFKTGSKGFFGVGKIVIDGKRYQTQVSLVEIGSKPKA